MLCRLDDRKRIVEKTYYGADRQFCNCHGIANIEYLYSPDGRAMTGVVTDEDGCAASPVAFEQFCFDENGRETKHAFYDANRQLTDALSYAVRTQMYDAEGNLIECSYFNAEGQLTDKAVSAEDKQGYGNDMETLLNVYMWKKSHGNRLKGRWEAGLFFAIVLLYCMYLVLAYMMWIFTRREDIYGDWKEGFDGLIVEAANVVEPNEPAGVSPRTKYEYSPYGNLLRKTDYTSKGKWKTRKDYDHRGNLKKIEYSNKLRNWLAPILSNLMIKESEYNDTEE